ncbi:flagellar hook-basal body protein FliE [Gordoniibacillus kamchatkensis]|uniref:Flagellar hook-basal body complex protein FliE n=1 Tax=Gordoniibacillus kamchatkensis TaxID=1590651 RepID=A0ABR5ADY1_9BACL|nr:flagellar hook-basal body complex protein FliE [Paenibacillus sp. VKM B-2647]KIL39249.1 flagellar hook-basal body protein FliE [Paenibacillus sp. VKM B-2647]
MIDKIGYKPLTLVGSAAVNNSDGTGASNVAKSFGAFLNGAIDDLNRQQSTVDQLNQQFVKGELSDVHQLTIASEKASLGLQVAVQVRNKVIEAYQEIMRMQV